LHFQGGPPRRNVIIAIVGVSHDTGLVVGTARGISVVVVLATGMESNVHQ